MDETRERQRPIKVYVSPNERAEITRRARATSHTVSNYLRNVGLAYHVKSTLDEQAIHALAKVNADQGRLGGLLKLWLSERPGDGAPVFEIRKLLNDIQATQTMLKAVVLNLR